MDWSGNLRRSRCSCNCSTAGGRRSSYVPISHSHSRAWQRVSLSLPMYLLFMPFYLFIPLPTSFCLFPSLPTSLYLSLLLPLWILFCCYFDITKRYQDIHRDTPPLFAELSHEVPMYQLAVNFPLCYCTVEPWNGPVEIAKWTHIHSFSFISFHPSRPLRLRSSLRCFSSPFFVAVHWFLQYFISFLMFIFLICIFFDSLLTCYERTRSSKEEFGSTGNEGYDTHSLLLPSLSVPSTPSLLLFSVLLIFLV